MVEVEEVVEEEEEWVVPTLQDPMEYVSVQIVVIQLDIKSEYHVTNRLVQNVEQKWSESSSTY